MHKIIYPGSYYPVYPNSWWKYMFHDSTIAYDSASSHYQLHNYISFQDAFKTEYSDKVYVPFLDGRPIYHYDKIEYHLFPMGYERWPILREEIGFEFKEGWVDPRYGNPEFLKKVKEKYFDGKDSVLVLQGYWSFAGGDVITIEEYKKNIGLSLYIKLDTLTHDTIIKKFLLDCHITFDSTSIAN